MLLVIFVLWFHKMKKETPSSEWLKSKEVMKILKIRACDVMHLREEGKLKFTKQGNAFLYSAESVLKQKK
jgi:hypothetical protein